VIFCQPPALRLQYDPRRRTCPTKTRCDPGCAARCAPAAAAAVVASAVDAAFRRRHHLVPHGPGQDADRPPGPRRGIQRRGRDQAVGRQEDDPTPLPPPPRPGERSPSTAAAALTPPPLPGDRSRGRRTPRTGPPTAHVGTIPPAATRAARRPGPTKRAGGRPPPANGPPPLPVRESDQPPPPRSDGDGDGDGDDLGRPSSSYIAEISGRMSWHARTATARGLSRGEPGGARHRRRAFLAPLLATPGDGGGGGRPRL
jgi:hypothetical protein